MLPTSRAKPSSTWEHDKNHPREFKGRQLPEVVHNLVNEIQWSPPSFLLQARGARHANWLAEAVTCSLRFYSRKLQRKGLFVLLTWGCRQRKRGQRLRNENKKAISTHRDLKLEAAYFGGASLQAGRPAEELGSFLLAGLKSRGSQTQEIKKGRQRKGRRSPDAKSASWLVVSLLPRPRCLSLWHTPLRRARVWAPQGAEDKATAQQRPRVTGFGISLLTCHRCSSHASCGRQPSPLGLRCLL